MNLIQWTLQTHFQRVKKIESLPRSKKFQISMIFTRWCVSYKNVFSCSHTSLNQCHTTTWGSAKGTRYPRLHKGTKTSLYKGTQYLRYSKAIWYMYLRLHKGTQTRVFMKVHSTWGSAKAHNTRGSTKAHSTWVFAMAHTVSEVLQGHMVPEAPQRHTDQRLCKGTQYLRLYLGTQHPSLCKGIQYLRFCKGTKYLSLYKGT